jgi:imidazolonepropionase-like amidohydrolase
VSRLSIRAARAWLGPGQVVDDAQVVCENGLIEYAGRAGGSGPGDEEILVDGVLLPAAADRHVHIELSDPSAVLRGGVTAVRDLGWPAARIFPLAELSEGPSYEGPLIRAAGPMLTAPGGYPTEAFWAPPDTGRVVEDAEAAAIAVGELAALGASAIKVSLNAEAGPTPDDVTLLAIVDAAHVHDLPVTAHAQGEGQVERALGAGIDELAHAPWMPLSDDLLRACAGAMRIVSTLDTLSFGRPTPELAVALDNLRRFHEAGGTVIYGTDLGNGAIPPGIHTRELLLLGEAGLSNEEVLAALTRAPIEQGAPADLIALSEDPLDDLRAFERLQLVVRAGRVLEP